MARARSVVPKMESMPASVGLSLRSCVKMGRPHAYGDVKATRGATKANPALWQVKAAEDGRLIRPTAARLSGRAVEATREEAFSAWARIGAALAGSADAGDRKLAASIVRFTREAGSSRDLPVREMRSPPEHAGPPNAADDRTLGDTADRPVGPSWMDIQYRARIAESFAEPPPVMNAPVLPEVLLGPQRADQPALPLASEGVQRYVWESAFGPMLIEVHDGVAFVNGQRVTSMDELRMSSGDGPP